MTFYSKKSYTATSGQASSKQFDIAFDLESGTAATSSKPYLSASHIKAKVDGVAVTDFTINEVPAVSTLTFGATVTVRVGGLVEIYRETPRVLSERTVDFTNASLLTEANLDQSAIHNQFLAQEALDGLFGVMTEGVGGDLDANSRRITNLGTPISQFDATTKDYVDTQIVFNGAASAQAWELTGTGSLAKFELTGPTPSATTNELYIVEVDGVLQSPSSGGQVRDFKVYLDEIDSKYYLEFEANAFPANTGNTNCPPNNARVSAQNMGVSKSTLIGNVVFESLDAAQSVITAKQATSQTAKPLVVQDSSGAEDFSVAPGGDIETKAGATLTTGQAVLQPGQDTDKGLVIKKSSASQSANLLELQTEAGSELGTAFSNLGHLTVGTTVEDPDYLLSLLSAASVGGLKISRNSESTATLLNVVDGGTNVLLRVENEGGVWKVAAINRALRVFSDTSSGSEAKHVVLTAGPSQIDDVLLIQDNGGTQLMEVDGRGTLEMRPSTIANDGLRVRSPLSDSTVWNVKADGQVQHRQVNAYGLVAAGGFKPSGATLSGRSEANYGDSFGPNGSTLSYSKVTDTITSVTFSQSLGTIDYKVRAVEFNPALNYVTEAPVSSKTATGFRITHSDEDTLNGAGNVLMVKFEVYL